MVWLSGATLALSLLMIGGLVGYIAVKGLGFFWPRPLIQVQTAEGPALGELVGEEPARGEAPARIQLRVGNRDVYGQDFRWIEAPAQRSTPEEAVLIERREYGVFIGRIGALLHGEARAVEGMAALKAAEARLPEVRNLQERIQDLEKREMGALNQDLETIRLERRTAEQRSEAPRIAALDAREKNLHERYERLQQQAEALHTKAREFALELQTVDGQTRTLPLADLIRVVPANRMGPFGKLGVYLSRLWEFLVDDPRESNTEGGIFPAIFGTVMMVMIMSALVVPLGVMAALYMREYAKQGWVIRILRVAVNNLAGVPSIVFGIFGLGFFVYTLGGSLDRLFFADRLPAPTFGTGGILWASLTLALLTVPVVIVATEEALAAVPRSQREASLALGATKWQTLWNVVLPGATPGILTGLILAMARGAGEVAPLMLTGVVKLAPAMPLDGTFPYLHLDRKFMHLGFHIYDVGFQSPNSEAAKPMVFMTALLLLLVVLVLNLAALRIRSRLRARLGGSTF